MKKVIFALLLLSNICLAQSKQEPVTYKYGQDGIEIILKNENETVLISTYKAKVTIKSEIAEKVMDLYNKNTESNQNITIVGKEATVTGKYFVEKKDKLTSVNFIYEKVEWNNGLVEVSE